MKLNRIDMLFECWRCKEEELGARGEQQVARGHREGEKGSDAGARRTS
jgi:hypothetical protein